MEYKFKTCIDCGIQKPVSHFHRRKVSEDKRSSYCGPCANARSIIWQDKNKNKIVGRRTAWRQKTPRQSLNVSLHGALKRRPTENPATLDDLVQMFDRQKGRCALSGIVLTWAQGKLLPTSITLDRIDQGRGYSADNLRLVCHAVNTFRSNMTDAEMLFMAEALILYHNRENHGCNQEILAPRPETDRLADQKNSP